MITNITPREMELQRRVAELEAQVAAMKGVSSVHTHDEEVPCSTHPDAPHGFDRNGSHSLGRYKCTCEGWKPEKPIQHKEYVS